ELARSAEVQARAELEPVGRAELGTYQPRRRTTTDRASTTTSSRAANENSPSSSSGSAVASSSFQRAPNRRTGSLKVIGSKYALKRSRNDSSTTSSPRGEGVGISSPLRKTPIVFASPRLQSRC